MSYAQAAGNGNQQERKYFNDSMVQCYSRNAALDDLLEALEKERILPHLTAIQKVKHGVMYALASDNFHVLQNLVLKGLDVDGVHLTFTYHKKRFTNVYVSNVLFGVKALDVQTSLSPYGLVKGTRMLYRDFRGYNLPTGDWSVSFERLERDIPSYVLIRGWLAYIKYDAQPQTCRQCGQSGHVFASCPQRRQKEARPEDVSKNRSDERTTEPESMDTHELPPPNEPNPTEEETKSSPTMQEEDPESYKPSQNYPGNREAYEEILENLESTVKEELAHVTVEDCRIPTSVESEDLQSEESSKQSHAWADSMDNSSEVGSEKPQETSKTKELRTKVKIKVGPVVYCPYCQVDSHTEEQCDKVSSARQTAKRKLGKKDSRPNRSESLGKKRKNIQG